MLTQPVAGHQQPFYYHFVGFLNKETNIIEPYHFEPSFIKDFIYDVEKAVAHRLKHSPIELEGRLTNVQENYFEELD